ncbi:MAG: aromatic ring-opening dioxygenase subunit LigA [Pseudomonadota bacterium]
MSLYYLQKFLYDLNRDEEKQSAYKRDAAATLDAYELSEEERRALNSGDIGLLYVLGVNGQILMHYAAFLGIEWFDYLDQMRKGVAKYGPVRAGVYAMTGDGERFTTEEQSRDKAGQS